MEKRILLKILSGPHLGAEARLVQGQEYIIGAGEQCDISLEDQLLEGRHCRLIFDGEAVHIAGLDGSVLVNREDIGTELQQLAFFQPVVIGTTCMAAGPENEVWPETLLSQVPNAIGGQQEQEFDGAAEGKTNNEEHAGEEKDEPAALGDAAEKLSGKRSGKEKTRGMHLFVVLVSVLLLAGGGWYLLSDKFAPVPMQQAVKQEAPEKAKSLSAEELIQMLQKKGWKGLSVQKNEQGRLLVNGYLSTDGQRRNVVSVLRDLPEKVNVRVYSEEAMVRECKFIITAKKLKAELENRGSGEFVLHGPSDMRDQLQSVAEILHRDVDGVQHVAVAVWASASPAVKGQPAGDQPYGLIIHLNTGRRYEFGRKNKYEKRGDGHVK